MTPPSAASNAAPRTPAYLQFRQRLDAGHRIAITQELLQITQMLERRLRELHHNMNPAYGFGNGIGLQEWENA